MLCRAALKKGINKEISTDYLVLELPWRMCVDFTDCVFQREDIV